ncbi:alpha 1,6 mannopyranosyltransferase [Corynebacterium sp. 4HC-13]|uniref:Alpha 1,6 mannopyranosyltransferase n=1 Tax=Corynebacterium anserum TaxID=2684406 RepID=A0A7G7YR13_9CORY|nr:alpha 1,6 mannopyranosyltransferase [Corynebacterium anserum]QNH96933.1 alpha 1,6 mannopyranosyltransferase [Corynebacterium anserum]
MSPLDPAHRLRLRLAMFLGTVGAFMIAIGGLGAGAYPVLHNPFWQLPFVSTLSRMLHASTVMVFLGIGILVIGWLLMARFCVSLRRRRVHLVPVSILWRTFVAWVIPLYVTAPLFTQDIYSYLAQGSIAARGWDPYAAGPVDLLEPDNPLVRSVPLMWSHSPAPYGPTALGYGAVISSLTHDSFVAGILLHRLVSIIGLALAGWALVRLSRRCGVPSQTAMWLGVLNPLALLHLVGGIHNEAAMLGLLLAGLELVLRGVDQVERPIQSCWILLILGLCLITAAGLVKVTALMALGFAAVAIARWFGGTITDLIKAGLISASVAVIVALVLSLGTGVGLGWITSQGGATEIVSWMSFSTVLGLASAFLGMNLGLGDHQRVALTVFRSLGVLVGIAWVVRMLWASFKGRIHPVGGLGLAMFLMVVFFPVVQPWYLLWAIFPLAAWANRDPFIFIAVAYSTLFSFAVLPRGLGLPPATVVYIYVMFVVIFAVVLLAGYFFVRAHPYLADAIKTGTPLDREALRRHKKSQ